MDKPIEHAWEEGMMAVGTADPTNPYIPGTDEHGAWRTGYLMAEESDRERETPAYQAEELIESVEKECRLADLGYAEIARRIGIMTTTLGNWLAMSIAMPTMLDDARRRLAQLTVAAVEVQHPLEDETREAVEQLRRYASGVTSSGGEGAGS